MPAPYRLPAPATVDPADPNLAMADPTPAVVVWAPAMADPMDLAQPWRVRRLAARASRFSSNPGSTL
ncbi:hypothetical protein BDA96_04G114500 [Sorghum bicolor]|uniref:Uncharacterized protein n=1 Tax=Sorghum bicolor TaxID=4558 RepID=A0A921R4V4_SORBI|nr:hypothetical protein BDA96_04G114500 [Sorghum bicolor]